MTTVRCQQSALYAAEGTVRDRGRTFAGVTEAQRFVDGLRATWWWPFFYWQVEYVEVGRARANGAGSVGVWYPEKNAGRIEMWHGHLTVPDITHELAHVLADARHGSKSHDPWFAREFLNLTYLISGSNAYVNLRDAFVRYRIEFIETA